MEPSHNAYSWALDKFAQLFHNLSWVLQQFCQIAIDNKKGEVRSKKCLNIQKSKHGCVIVYNKARAETPKIPITFAWVPEGFTPRTPRL